MSGRTIGLQLASVLVLAAVILIVYLIVSTLISRNSPCKSDTTCPANQICDARVQRCVSLPGFSCLINNGCSIYGPICQPRDHYCTNIASQPRGTAGNPAISGNGAKCNSGLVYNSRVNLCQEPAIGSICTINAQCNLGVCNQITKTCQYATLRCTTDTVLNPTQCDPPAVCDPSSLSCLVPGTTPGGEGTECNQNSDCARGNSCISGPPGAGWKGVCRSGYLTWLMNSTASSPGNTSSCLTPLVGVSDTSWCRYDIENFMKCSSLDQCEYPYASCDPTINTCVAVTADPISAAMTGFLYSPVGVNSTNSEIAGMFFRAAFPTSPPIFGDEQGGKIITPFLDFLKPPAQFADQLLLAGRQLVSFSRYTSFTVASITIADIQYFTAVTEDPDPMLVMTSIIPVTPDFSYVYISFYSQSYAIPFFSDRPTYHVLGGLIIKSDDARIWNPAAVALFNSGLNVSFIQNPIVSSDILVLPKISPLNFPLSMIMTSTLLYSNGSYYLGFLLTVLSPPNPVFTASALVIPAYIDSGENIIPLSPQTIIITSWDSISTAKYVSPTSFNIEIFTTVLMYGIDSNGNYSLYTCCITFVMTSSPGCYLFTQYLKVENGTGYVKVQLATMPDNMRKANTHCRITRAVQQEVERLLILTIFHEIPAGLAVEVYAFDSTTALNIIMDNPATTSTIKDVKSIFYVTSVTAGLNFGAFCVWCSTKATRSTFILVQTNARFINSFTSQPVFSGIFWRRLNGDPDDYFLYPVGGAGVPYFLATKTAMKFDGTPQLLRPYAPPDQFCG